MLLRMSSFRTGQILGSEGNSVVETPDSSSKGAGFESWPERREFFLLQGQLSVLTFISVQHVKGPGHSAKSAGGRLQLS